MPHVPRRRFGQNFLIDEAIIDAILGAIGPRPDDNVVEIGPGLGALTRPLLTRLARLHVVEIDRDIAAHLRRVFPPQRLILHEGDALAFDFSAFGPHLRVVGNLPYNISTPLLFHLALHAAGIEDLHVMLQNEVVDRMVAQPGSSEYGRLSVTLQHRFALEKLFEVPATAFRPVPQVESAVVRLIPVRKQEQCDEPLFSKLVARAFMQRRKTLRNALRDYLEGSDFAALGIPADARAQELTPGDYVRMANYLAAR